MKLQTASNITKRRPNTCVLCNVNIIICRHPGIGNSVTMDSTKLARKLEVMSYDPKYLLNFDVKFIPAAIIKRKFKKRKQSSIARDLKTSQIWNVQIDEIPFNFRVYLLHKYYQCRCMIFQIRHSKSKCCSMNQVPSIQEYLSHHDLLNEDAITRKSSHIGKDVFHLHVLTFKNFPRTIFKNFTERFSEMDLTILYRLPPFRKTKCLMFKRQVMSHQQDR